MRCKICHRPLKGQQSIKQGMGRVCYIKSFGRKIRRQKTTILNGHVWQQAGPFDEVANGMDGAGFNEIPGEADEIQQGQAAI
jgi:hypothetical protein